MLVWIIIYIYLGAFLVHIFIQLFLKFFTPLCKEFFQILPPFLPVQICVLPYHLFYLPLSFSLGISHFTIWSFIFWYSLLSLFYLLLCLFRNQHSIRSSSFPIPLMISLLSHYSPLTSYLLAYLSVPPPFPMETLFWFPWSDYSYLCILLSIAPPPLYSGNGPFYFPGFWSLYIITSLSYIITSEHLKL